MIAIAAGLALCTVTAWLGWHWLLLAAGFHEYRHEPAAKGLPQGVAQLIERWRQVRVLGGGDA